MIRALLLPVGFAMAAFGDPADRTESATIGAYLPFPSQFGLSQVKS